MSKNLFHLIPATFILLCCAFAKQEKRSSEIKFPPSQEEFSSVLEETPSILKSDIWDVSDVNISEIDPTKKLISFTFDDAPARTLESILTVFADFNEQNPDCKASATLFLNGYRFDNQTPHWLHLAKALGWELGNHTQSHLNLTTLSKETLSREISQTDAVLQRIDGKSYHLLRAPFGRVNDLVREVAKTPIIDWTIDTLDWSGKSAKEIYDAVFNQKYAGAIVLMHDGYEATVSALKTLLPDLKTAGYQVVSVSKMIKAHDCKLRRGQVYIRARKSK